MKSEQQQIRPARGKISGEETNPREAILEHPLAAPYESEDLTVHMDCTWFPVAPEEAPVVIARIFEPPQQE